MFISLCLLFYEKSDITYVIPWNDIKVTLLRTLPARPPKPLVTQVTLRGNVTLLPCLVLVWCELGVGLVSVWSWCGVGQRATEIHREQPW